MKHTIRNGLVVVAGVTLFAGGGALSSHPSAAAPGKPVSTSTTFNHCTNPLVAAYGDQLCLSGVQVAYDAVGGTTTWGIGTSDTTISPGGSGAIEPVCGRFDISRNSIRVYKGTEYCTWTNNMALADGMALGDASPIKGNHAGDRICALYYWTDAATIPVLGHLPPLPATPAQQLCTYIP